MTLARTYERNSRSAPRTAFSGGHVEHGRIQPMQTPGFFAQLLERISR